MFLQHYGMREHPFGVTPNPRYLYLSPTHREALASLIYGVEAGRGFMGLIAQPGMGKTTLLFQLLELLGSSARTVFLFHTECDSREFLHYLLSDMGIDSQGEDLARMHDKLNQVLLAEAQSGRRFVLVVDEAQNLAEPVLETVRLLSNFETRSSKLMRIILAGQPQLAKKLALPGLAQLRQRMSLFARLEPFGLAETRAYVDHRLKVAGYEGPPLFTAEAMEMIAARGEGIPRNINNLCFNALSLGFALQKKKIDSTIVQEVLSDLDVNMLTGEAVPGTPDAQPAVQRTAARAPYRSTRLADRLRPALSVGTLVATVFVAACLLVFVGERAGFRKLVPRPQTVNTSGNTHPTPTPGSGVETNRASSVNAEAHTEVTSAPSPAQVSQGTMETVAPHPPQARIVLPKVETEPSSSLRPPHDAASGGVDSGNGSATMVGPGDLKTYRLAMQQSPGTTETAAHPAVPVRLPPVKPETPGGPTGQQPVVRQPPTAGPEPQQEVKSAADQRYSGASHTETDRSQAHLEAGRILPARNRVDEAVTEFRQGLRLQLDSAETHRALSAALFEKGDVDGAIAEYRDAIRLGPDDAGDHINIGLALYVKGDLDGAIAEYREAVRLNPNDPNNHFLLGNALAKKPDLDACIAELRETVRLRPDFAAAHDNLGSALEQRNDRRSALEQYRIAHSIEPNNLDYRFHYEHLSHELGR
jgi:general secretion pathway protein A